MSERWHGVFTALVTPFRGDGALDEAALRRLVQRQIVGGVAGLVPCGTTGEAATLDADEHERVVQVTVEETQLSERRVRVLAGAGANDTRRAVELARRSERAGADALLVVTPYYNKPTQPGLLAHFRAVAEAASLPIVVYNVPSRTGVNLEPRTLLELARDERFVGVKEASGNLDQASEIQRGRPPGFALLSGEDSLTLPMLALGGEGVIAVVANEAPEALVELVDLARRGDRMRAAQLHAKLFPLMKANFKESNPIPVKWALHRLGLIENVLRPPLTPLSEAHHAALEAALAEAGVLERSPA